MPQLFLTRDQSRRIDQVAIEELGFNGLVLMENAARGVVDRIRDRLGGRIVILSGHGNNGGDGFAIARQLAAENHSSDIWLVNTGKQLSPDAAANLALLTATGISVHTAVTEDQLQPLLSNLTASDLIIDALLGTGVQGAVKSPHAEVIRAINNSAAFKVAVDVPSGLNCDTGTAEGPCVRAQRTITFVAQKIGFRNIASREFTGEVHVAHIGIPSSWIQQWATNLTSPGST